MSRFSLFMAVCGCASNQVLCKQWYDVNPRRGRPLGRRFRLASIVYQPYMDMPVRMFKVRKDIGEWKGDGWEGYRWRRGVFPKTLNAQRLRLEAAVCQAPYSGRLFEYSSSGSGYVLHATLFWEKDKGRF